MRILTWIIGLPIAIMAAAFAVANRQNVDLDLWPLPFTVHLGVYLAVLGALAVGLLLGLLIGRVTSAARAQARVQAVEVKMRALEVERDQLQSRTSAEALSPPSAAA
ncbi:MAG: DUF1049 domain-containing protein [Rhodospirillaceae bacterium]|nr:DUF1049 domain-containing protein [Rhodospirillaceae bacterium]